MNNKKGSSAVFLTVILAALISIVFALIYGVRESSVSSRIDGVISLAGDSLLSEFNYDVQKEYGLFMICGTDKEMSRKLKSYVDYSIKNMKDVKINSIRASIGRFSVINKEPVKKQILEHMKMIETKNIVSGREEDSMEGQLEGRILRHGPTIVSLPSAMVPKRKLTALAESIAENASKVDEVFKKGTEMYLVNRYIEKYFNSSMRVVDEEHFFRNEAEYILGGELSDRKNRKRVEIALKAMRFPLNLAHIYADNEKNAATMTMAQLMTPGAAAAATQAVLASTWAYAEADNDVKLLLQGYEVPIVKDKTTWAIDLDSAVDGLLGRTVVPDATKGYNYDEYLQIMMYFQDENIKIARIMDLIQINMRKNHDANFLIQEYATGIDIEATVNGKQYSYEKKY